MFLAQKGSWIWFYIIKSVDMVINMRTLWLWYFECDLAVPYITQEDCWWKATRMNTKYKKIRVLPYGLNYWKWGSWTMVFQKSNILFPYYSFSYTPLTVWQTISVKLHFWKDFDLND